MLGDLEPQFTLSLIFAISGPIFPKLNQLPLCDTTVFVNKLLVIW